MLAASRSCSRSIRASITLGESLCSGNSAECCPTHSRHSPPTPLHLMHVKCVKGSPPWRAQDFGAGVSRSFSSRSVRVCVASEKPTAPPRTGSAAGRPPRESSALPGELAISPGTGSPEARRPPGELAAPPGCGAAGRRRPDIFKGGACDR